MSSIAKPPIEEKGFIPPVPTLSKNAHDLYSKSEAGYGYTSTPGPVSHYSQSQKSYSSQPHLESPVHEDPQRGIHPLGSNDSMSHLNSGTNESMSKSSILPSRPSRSVARMAVAESAAANASADPLQRYQPKKPSPLALKAAEERKAANLDRKEPFRSHDTNAEETLAGSNEHLEASERERQSRQLSGEWGVALGSPNNDGSFASQQQQYGSEAGPIHSRYSNDPYLAAAGQSRVPSGQYSTDPYASYHDGQQQTEYPTGSKRGNWV